MAIALGLLALGAFGYFVYREMSKPKATGMGGGGVKSDDHTNPSKK